jgi:hypothetical protein
MYHTHFTHVRYSHIHTHAGYTTSTSLSAAQSCPATHAMYALHCRYTVGTLLLHCCYTIVTLLSRCCHSVVSLLLLCCYTLSFAVQSYLATHATYADKHTHRHPHTHTHTQTHTHTHTHTYTHIHTHTHTHTHAPYIGGAISDPRLCELLVVIQPVTLQHYKHYS